MKFIRDNKAFTIFVLFLVSVVFVFGILYHRAHITYRNNNSTTTQIETSYESEQYESTTYYSWMVTGYQDVVSDEDIAYPESTYPTTTELSTTRISTTDLSTTTSPASTTTVTSSTTRWSFTIKSSKKYYDIPVSDEDQDFIDEACDYYSFDNEILYKMMSVESDYNKNCMSKTNDHGIMQVNYNYYSDYVKNGDEYDKYMNNLSLYDIRQNVIIALREIVFWRKECNRRGYYDYCSILECYNKGYSYFNRLTSGYYDKVVSVDISYR